ncbi:MAG: Phage tail fiber protein, partial [Caulobacter sp.]|nr:Phage tail fiber protein [Caulobacter sp.]
QRRFVGLKVGEVRMTPPAGGEAAAALALDAASPALMVRSPLTDVFGALSVHGAVSVGQLAGAEAALSVQPGAPQAGAGTISSDGALLYGNAAYELALAVSGDQIMAPAPVTAGGVADVSGAEDLTVLSVVGQTATVSAAPRATLDQAPYAVSRGTLLRVRSDPLTTAMEVSIDGQVGVGGPPAPSGQARLTVRGGDLLIDDGHDLRFLQDGSVKAVGPNASAPHQINFLASQSILEAREAGQILFDSGEPVRDSTPGLILAVNQNVGIGVAAPAYRLSVDGEIRLSGGVIFTDGTTQTQGVAAIPVGTIISWWNGDQQLSWSSVGFQLCNGSTITDPESPLVGTKTPDLRGIYVRGAVSYDQIGATGGAATHTHGYSLGDHTHRIDHTHLVAGYTTSVIGGAGQNIDGDKCSTDHHMHTINGNSGNCSPNVTGPPPQTAPATTDPAPNQPPYMQLLKAMRIK